MTRKLLRVLPALLLGLIFLSGPVPEAGAQGLTEDIEWDEDLLERDEAWFASADGRAVADNVLRYQSSYGAWPKDTDLAVWPPRPGEEDFTREGVANTIDNDATTVPIAFLARSYRVTGEKAYLNSFRLGLKYLFRAQYKNGGWPQFYPLRDGYRSRITFNDDAMINVMNLLTDIVEAEYPYDFVGRSDRKRAWWAVAKGIRLILRTQIRQDGVLTAWAAQYDEFTLEPAWARAYEPPSISGQESVRVVQYLERIKYPWPGLRTAIKSARDWFRRSAIFGLRYERYVDAEGNRDGRVLPDPEAPALWARFYEIETNLPIFTGRDSVIRYSLEEVEQERRGGYSYYTTRANALDLFEDEIEEVSQR